MAPQPLAGSDACSRPTSLEVLIRGPVPQFSEADIDPASRDPKEWYETGVAAQPVGDFNFRAISWKRGSLRSGCMSGSVS